MPPETPVAARLGGFAEERLRRSASQTLATSDIHRYIRMVEEKRYGGESPLGEQAGLWLEAAIMASEWTGDALLRQRTTGMLERLLAAQDPDGYLGARDARARFRGPEPQEFAATLNALSAAWEVWRSGPALRAASDLARLLVARFDPAEAAILAAPLLRVYRAAEDPAILAWCGRAARDPLARLCLDEIAGRIPAAGHPAAGPTAVPAGGIEIGALADAILYNRKLGELTGNAACDDAVERLLWNHAFASETVDGDGFRCRLPEDGWKPQGYYAGPDSCGARGPLMLAGVPYLFYASGPDTIRVRQYGPSAARMRVGGVSVQVSQETEYPSRGRVSVSVDPAAPVRFTVRFRVPAWCPNPSIRLNGAPSHASIRRVWRKGDRVELDFPMRPRLEPISSGKTALWRGPLLYTLDGRFLDDATIRRLPGLTSVGAPSRERPLSGVASLGPALEVPLRFADGSSSAAELVPFANLGDWYRNPSEKSDWLERIAVRTEAAASDPAGRVLPYSVWLPLAAR